MLRRYRIGVEGSNPSEAGGDSVLSNTWCFLRSKHAGASHSASTSRIWELKSEKMGATINYPCVKLWKPAKTPGKLYPHSLET